MSRKSNAHGKAVPSDKGARSANPTAALPSSRQHLIALAGFALLTLLMFGDLLLRGGGAVPGSPDADLCRQFLGWRNFGFEELARGHVTLWNPHIYCGAPYFGGFQAALLYPPNLLFLFLPVVPAANWSIALHVFLMGAFMYAWMRHRGLSLEPAFFAGVLMMFGGSYFTHVYAGHLPNLCAMVWAPLILLAIDWTFAATGEQPRGLPVKPVLLGMLAVAMQIFAGHPQYVMFTAIAAGCYSLLRLMDAQRRAVLLPALAAIYVGGALLAAVQLATGLQANAETVRGVKLPFEFAAMFSFPPENFLTLLAPDFFRSAQPEQVYWGRWLQWEVCFFSGVTGFICAIYGALFCENRLRRVFIPLIGFLLVLSLGIHTPLFRLLYDHVPGFDKFRGICKFIFPASLFFVALAAHGLDRMMRLPRIQALFVWGVFGLACALAAATLWLRVADWQAFARAMVATNESYLSPSACNNPEFLAAARSAAIQSLLIAAATTGIMGILLRLPARTAWPRRSILALAVVELFCFARASRGTAVVTTLAPAGEADFLASKPGDYRILTIENPNDALALGAQDIWGNDPGIVRRYAEFIAFCQGLNPDQVTQNISLDRYDPLFAMLRLRYTFQSQATGMHAMESPDPMPHVQLVSRFRVLPGRDRIFAAMREPQFNPRGEVLLESTPQPAPDVSATNGTARIVNSSTDCLEIEADTLQPTILLITDVYTPAWRAVALDGSSQSQYDLLPGDYFLRAVPLGAGHHHLRVEYAPRAYSIGKWISLASWLAFIAAATAFFRTRKRARAL